MRCRVLIGRLTSVVVSKDPAVTGIIRLVLIRRLFDFEPVASLVRFTVEDDRHPEVSAVVQLDHALIGHRSAFHDPAITPRAAGETDADRTGEQHCDLKQQLNKITERREGIGVAGLVLPGQVADATEEII